VILAMGPAVRARRAALSQAQLDERG
jgi:hypothetical protein